MSQTPEGRVKTAIKRWLVDRGIWYFMPVSNGMGSMGIPDFICCWNGGFLGIEAKAPGEKPTERQLDRHIEMRSANGVVIVADSVSCMKELEPYL